MCMNGGIGRWFWVLIVAGGLFAGAGQAMASKADNTLYVSYWREVVTLDGHFSNLRENDILGLLVDDALFYVDHETLKPVPLLAKSHKFVNDTTLDIEIRQGVKFHDGSAVTPEDVAYSLNTIINPKSNSNFTLRVGLWLDKATVTGPQMVRLQMKRPYAMVLWDLCYYAKVRKKGIYDNPKTPGEINATAQATTLNGTGPYRVTEFRPGQRIALERFKEYRKDSAKGTPTIERIVIRTIPDFSTQAAEFMSGGIHWSYQVPNEIAEDVAKSGRAKHISGPSMRVGYIVLDAAGKSTVKNHPLLKVKVRQALNHAVDRETIVKTLIKGQAIALHSACNPVQFGCTQDIRKYEYSPEKAKALLAEAGYPTGFPLELWGGRDKEVLEAIVNYWGQVGVKTTLRFVKEPTVTKAYREGQAMAYYGSKGSFSIPDAAAVMTEMFAGDSFEAFHGDKEVAELVVGTMSTHDPKVRQERFHKLVQRVAEQAYWVPTYVYSEEYMASNDIEFEAWKDGMQRLFLIRWK